MKKTKQISPLFTGSEWDFETLEKTWKVIDDIGTNQLEFDYYPAQIEIISSEQMLDNYSSHAMPTMYNHWSFGKSFIQNEQGYKSGQSGLAYEVVINTNPSIAYLMENNTMTMQALVLAHASVGHSSFFKTNYLFKDWSDADSILDYLKFAKNYISSCEEKYGSTAVEELLDACHSLQLHGVDKYKKPHIKRELKQQQKRQNDAYIEEHFNDIWRTLPDKQRMKYDEPKKPDLDVFPEENILYFIEKHSPVLKPWQREIVRIVRKIAQYFYPQRQTQLMNEGWACMNHHTILSMMQEQGHITPGSFIEAMRSHAGVVYQPDWDHKYYSGINVYALGYAMMVDLRRVCENPDDEDRHYFPQLCDTDWRRSLSDIVNNYRDESFVLQFLSPKIIRQFKLFSFNVDDTKFYYEVNNTHADDDVLEIRKNLSAQYDLSKRIPQMEIVDVDWEGDRTLSLVHYTENDVLLSHEDAKKTATYLHVLWGHPINIQYRDSDGEDV